jgi:hypothetical protein
MPARRDLRDFGRSLNARADARTAALFRQAAAPSMAEIVLSRFDQNARLKPVVARLALSDVFHPIDTLRRTERTARVMWAAYGRGRGGVIDRWRLVFAYSACVIAWLLDNSPDQRLTRGVVRGALTVIGVR